MYTTMITPMIVFSADKIDDIVTRSSFPFCFDLDICKINHTNFTSTSLDWENELHQTFKRDLIK